jgi:hypothetical protein
LYRRSHLLDLLVPSIYLQMNFKIYINPIIVLQDFHGSAVLRMKETVFISQLLDCLFSFVLRS